MLEVFRYTSRKSSAFSLRFAENTVFVMVLSSERGKDGVYVTDGTLRLFGKVKPVQFFFMCNVSHSAYPFLAIRPTKNLSK